MSEIDETFVPEPHRRDRVAITNNAILECSQFCITNCGLYGEAQYQAVMMSAWVSGKTVVGSFGEGEPDIHALEEEPELPKLIMSCKGPRKKYWIAGELVCRKKAKVDTL